MGEFYNRKQIEAMMRSLKAKLEREAEDITHAQFAGTLGISVTTVSRWVNGHTIPRSQPVLACIEKYLKSSTKEK